jgi:hypothetical protein
MKITKSGAHRSHVSFLPYMFHLFLAYFPSWLIRAQGEEQQGAWSWRRISSWSSSTNEAAHVRWQQDPPVAINNATACVCHQRCRVILYMQIKDRYVHLFVVLLIYIKNKTNINPTRPVVLPLYSAPLSTIVCVWSPAAAHRRASRRRRPCCPGA